MYRICEKIDDLLHYGSDNEQDYGPNQEAHRTVQRARTETQKMLWTFWGRPSIDDFIYFKQY